MKINILNHRGFTLVEVMIAITVLSFIMIAVVSITGSSQNTKDRKSAKNEKRGGNRRGPGQKEMR